MDIGVIPGISAEICATLVQVFARFGTIEKVFLFGSRAKNTYKNGSDIDLAVFSSKMSGAEFSNLWNQIDALPIIFTIDILHWDALTNLALKEKIVSEGQLFYKGL